MNVTLNPSMGSDPMEVLKSDRNYRLIVASESIKKCAAILKDTSNTQQHRQNA